MSRFMPCTDCGESVDTVAPYPHACTPERLADFQLFHLREEVAALESRITAWLDSSPGRFEAWLAAREVRRSR